MPDDDAPRAARAADPVSPRSFFLLAFALSWLVWVPLMLVRLRVVGAGFPPSALTPIALLGVLMPSVAATILATRAGGRAAAGALWRGLFAWRFGRWWAPVLLIQPVLLIGSALAVNVVAPGSVRPVSGLTASAFAVNCVFLLLASTGEEIGWRGLGLPGLQCRYSPLVSTVIIGLVTATWHLPYWIVTGSLEQFGWGYFLLNCLFILGISFHLTWLYNGARASVLVAVAFHVVFNIVNVALLPVTSSVAAFGVLTALEWGIALLLLPALRQRPARSVRPAA